MNEKKVSEGYFIPESINCRCTFVRIQGEPKQIDLFGEFVPATLSFQNMMKELNK